MDGEAVTIDAVGVAGAVSIVGSFGVADVALIFRAVDTAASASKAITASNVDAERSLSEGVARAWPW